MGSPVFLVRSAETYRRLTIFEFEVFFPCKALGKVEKRRNTLNGFDE